MEEHTRLNFACNSLNEWFIATISSILRGSKEGVESATADNLEGLKGELSYSLDTALDLLSSVGTSLLDGTLASALTLGELTVVRRDALLSNGAKFVDFSQKEAEKFPHYRGKGTLCP